MCNFSKKAFGTRSFENYLYFLPLRIKLNPFMNHKEEFKPSKLNPFIMNKEIINVDSLYSSM